MLMDSRSVVTNGNAFNSKASFVDSYRLGERYRQLWQHAAVRAGNVIGGVSTLVDRLAWNPDRPVTSIGI